MSAPSSLRFYPLAVGHLLSGMALLLLILLPGPAVAETSRTISIGIVSDNRPYSSMNGREAAGFSIDVLKEVEQHTPT